MKIRWHKEPQDHNYPAAASYLSLIFKPKHVKQLVKELKTAPIQCFKAKDIFRASALSLLGVSNSHVIENQKKIEAGRKLSPILLVRDSEIGKVIIADGYHRLCSVYTFDEDALIPSKIVTR